jgi:hypothetical protein
MKFIICIHRSQGVISWKTRWVVHVVRVGEMRDIDLLIILLEEPELGRHICARKDNIKMNIKVIGCQSVYWTELIQDEAL